MAPASVLPFGLECCLEGLLRRPQPHFHPALPAIEDESIELDVRSLSKAFRPSKGGPKPCFQGFSSF